MESVFIRFPNSILHRTNGELEPERLRFGRLKQPIDAYISKNQVASRIIIELLGLDPALMLLARNKYERIEKAIWSGCWLVIGLLIPIALQMAYRRVRTQTLQRAFNLPKQISPLKINFEFLDTARFTPHTFIHELEKQLVNAKEPIPFTAEQKQQLLPKASKLANELLRSKLFLMFTDLLFLGINGQVGNWIKNWVTERLSGKKGFSGVFDYTSEAYRQQKSAQHEKSKKTKQILSLAIGAASVMAFPLLFYKILKSPKALGVGIAGKLKQWVPHFNSTDAIYMSKWVMCWHSVFNNFLPGLFAARDSHEMREHTARMTALEFFFFWGDEIFSGLGAKLFHHFNQDRLKGLQIFQEKKIGPFKIPFAVPYHELEAQLQQTKGVDPIARQLANTLGRLNFWIGLLSTCLGLGVTFTLVNNWYTRKKVLAEQAVMKRSSQNTTLKKPFAPTLATIPKQPLSTPLSAPQTLPLSPSQNLARIMQLQPQKEFLLPLLQRENLGVRREGEAGTTHQTGRLASPNQQGTQGQVQLLQGLGLQEQGHHLPAAFYQQRLNPALS